jgi:hypothetical protein
MSIRKRLTIGLGTGVLALFLAVFPSVLHSTLGLQTIGWQAILGLVPVALAALASVVITISGLRLAPSRLDRNLLWLSLAIGSTALLIVSLFMAISLISIFTSP